MCAQTNREEVMLIAIAKETHIPEWLYPHRLAPLSGEVIKTGQLARADFEKLWSALGTDHSDANAFDMDVSTHCDVGFSHDAEDYLPRLNPTFVNLLAGLQDSQRWQVCQKWTPTRLGRRPNSEQITRDKKQLKMLCDFAGKAVANQWLVVFIEDQYFPGS
jgi:hypothetical protein